MNADHKFATEQPKHPIQVVARRTGLTPDVIRAWERRHRAVAPERSSTSRRLYSDSEVERLILLRRATLLGRRIGDVAHLPTADLRALVAADESATGRAPSEERKGPFGSPAAHGHLEACLEALAALDSPRFESALGKAALVLSAPVLIDQVLAPLLRRVGDSWQAGGALGIRHEHLATELIGSLLTTLRTAHSTPGPGPELLLTTPVGQAHELGARMAGVFAAALGWRVSYLGPSLPAAEIASAATLRRARAVALSLVFPEGDPGTAQELERLHGLLPGDTAVLIGGQAAGSYERVVHETGAERVPTLSDLASVLERLR